MNAAPYPVSPVLMYRLGMSTGGEPRWTDERQVRHQIDRAVGRALVDRAFAARLLANPTLAVGTRGCDPTQYQAVKEIRARHVDEFARQIFDQFWSTSRVSTRRTSPIRLR
jgi:hypothetical protein